MKVLFICTGNTCRSPMAEGILRDMAEKRALDIEVSSAGIAVYNHSFAAKNSIEAMKAINIDITGHRSRQADEELIQEADLILTMTQAHKYAILSFAPSAKDKVYNLHDYASGQNKDVMDPYQSSLGVYEKTRDEIYEAVRLLVEKL